MSKEIGAHLLGRVPSPPDEHDYKMADYLDAHDQISGVLTKSMTLQEVHDQFPLDVWSRIYAFWKAFKALFAATPTPAPAPIPPTPAPDGGVWLDAEQLDQGDTGHCVGFGWCQWGNTVPVNDHFANADGDTVYYECKVIDGEPRREDGSNVRSGAKAMQNRSRLGVYAFAANTDEITAWLKQHGAVVVGTDWYNAMFKPEDHNGFLVPTGGVAGGHCWLLIGYLADEDAYVMQNSWGSSWGQNGRAKIKVSDFAKLLAGNGEACSALELAL